MTPIEPLIFQYLQKCNYFTLSTTTTSHITSKGSKSMMNASQTNSSTQIKDLWPSLVTTQSQKFERLSFIKHMQHHNGSTNDPFSPSHLYKQQQLAKKKPLLIRLSHVKTINVFMYRYLRNFFLLHFFFNFIFSLYNIWFIDNDILGLFGLSLFLLKMKTETENIIAK